MKNIIAGIRRGDPNAKILINATWIHYGMVELLLKEYGVNIDLLGWDWYSNMDTYGLEKLLDNLWSRFQKDILFCEMNIWTKDEPQSAMGSYLTERMKKLYELKNSKHIVGACIYELLDEPNHGTGSEGVFGLVNVDKRNNILGPKQAYKDVQALLGGRSRNKILLSDLHPQTPTTVPTTAPPATQTSPQTSSQAPTSQTPARPPQRPGIPRPPQRSPPPCRKIPSPQKKPLQRPRLTGLYRSQRPVGGMVVLIVALAVVVLGGGGAALYIFV